MWRTGLRSCQGTACPSLSPHFHSVTISLTGKNYLALLALLSALDSQLFSASAPQVCGLWRPLSTAHWGDTAHWADTVHWADTAHWADTVRRGDTAHRGDSHNHLESLRTFQVSVLIRICLTGAQEAFCVTVWPLAFEWLPRMMACSLV